MCLAGFPLLMVFELCSGRNPALDTGQQALHQDVYVPVWRVLGPCHLC